MIRAAVFLAIAAFGFALVALIPTKPPHKGAAPATDLATLCARPSQHNDLRCTLSARP